MKFSKFLSSTYLPISSSVAHFDISVFEQPGECIQDRSPKVLVGRHAENTLHIKHILPILLRLLLGRLCALDAVRHEPLQLGQGLFDLGNGTGAVY